MTRHYALTTRGMLAPPRPGAWWVIRYSDYAGDEDSDITDADDPREEARALAIDAGGSVLAIVGPYETHAQALAAMAGVQL